MSFNAGQAGLPSCVHERIVEAVNYWAPAKQSILTVPYTHNSFKEIGISIRQSIKTLMQIPDSHTVLIIPAGARYQFSQCAMFLGQHTNHVSYIISGYWSEMASNAAKRWLKVSEHDKSDVINDSNDGWVYYTDNETIEGVEFKDIPARSRLVSDMTSNILTRFVDWSVHDIVFASSQKNLGISGSCVVIVRKSLLIGGSNDVFSYSYADRLQSMHVTPCVLTWFTLYSMLKWYESQGGVREFEEKLNSVSNQLYSKLDSLPMFNNLVNPKWRSRVSIVFDLAEELSTQHFIDQSEKEGFMGLKGHKARGGIRVSLYNSVRRESVSDLTDFLEHYGKVHG